MAKGREGEGKRGKESENNLKESENNLKERREKEKENMNLG